MESKSEIETKSNDDNESESTDDEEEFEEIDDVDWVEEPPKQPEPKSLSVTSHFINKCPNCGKTVNGIPDLSKHCRKTKCKIDHCPSCNKEVSGLKGLLGHVKACPGNPEYQKKLKAKEEKENKIENSRETISDEGRDVMTNNKDQSTGISSRKEPIIKAEGSRLRGKVQDLKRRIRALPKEERESFSSDNEVLRDYGYDLSLKSGLTDEVIGKMAYIVEDIENAIRDTEESIANKNKIKPDDLEENNGEIDYVKKLNELEKAEDQAYSKQLYRRLMEAKINNYEQGLPFNKSVPKPGNNGNQAEFVDYTTVDGDRIKIARSDAIDLEKERMKVKQQLEREKRDRERDDPITDYPIMEDGKWSGKVIKVRTSTADRLALLERTAQSGQGNQQTNALSELRETVLGEVGKIREEMNEEKVQKRLDKLEHLVVNALNRDPTEEAIEWKQKLQQIGALGTDRDMEELKHIHSMEGSKFNQAANMMAQTQSNLGYVARKGVDLVESIALDKKRSKAQSETTEPMVEGMNEMRIDYPPGGKPLPPTHDFSKETMTYRDYVEEIPGQQQQANMQPAQNMSYQQYVPDYAGPPPQPTNPPPQQYQQPQYQQPQPQPQYQQPQPQPQPPPPQPIPHSIPYPNQQQEQIPIQQAPPIQKQKLTMKDIVPDDIIINTKGQEPPPKTTKKGSKKAA